MAAAFVFVPPRTPSPRAEELARRLSLTIDEFARENPGVPDAEVREALRLAARGRGGEAASALLGIAAAVVAAGALVFLLARPGPHGAFPSLALLPVLVAVLAACVAVALRRRR